MAEPIDSYDYWYYLDHERNHSVLKMRDKIYSQAITLNESFWTEADIDTRFRAGDQTLWNELYGNLPAYRKRQFTFNRIRRICNMISGYQRRNRKSITAVPIENSDNLTATQFTKILMWASQKNNMLETISTAFDSAITTGMSLLNIWMDYSRDPISGDIRLDEVPYNEFLIDPYFRKFDLSDCNYVWRRKYLSKNELITLFPKHAEEIAEMPDTYQRDDKFQFMAEAYNFQNSPLFYLDEIWYRDLREQTVIIDMQNGESIEWQGTDDDLNEFKKIHSNLISRKTLVPTVRVSYIVKNKVLYDGPNPNGSDRYPFVPILCYYEPQLPYYPYRIQGVVRNLRDSQYLYNRRKIIELDILESQVNSGFIYKEDALVNPKDIYLTGQGRGIAVKETSSIADVQPIQPPQVPPSMIQISESLGREILEISGVNEELLGSAEDDKAGYLAMLRQGAGLTTLQIIFDQLDTSMKIAGKLMIDYCQNNFSPGKVKRILQEEPSLEFYNKAFGIYDIAIEEGFNTTTQRQLQFKQLLYMRELGLPIPSSVLLESATIQNKEELIQSVIQQEQQNQQLQQAQAQAALEFQQAQIENINSQSVANKGLGIERISRVEENRALAVERLAGSQKDRQAATLDMVKAFKELQMIDLNQLQTFIGILDNLKQMVPQGQEETVEDITETNVS